MSEVKRYFWLKLKKDMFREPKLKKLRRLKNGDTKTIIYLKLLLECIDKEGIITRDYIEDDPMDELAFLIDEDKNEVAETMLHLSKMKLVEEGEDYYFFKDAVENTGSKSDSAERVAVHRAKQKCYNVTPM